MSAEIPPREVIDIEAGAGGFLHVGVFLARAFGHRARPTLDARADLYKCVGADLPGCAACVRHVAPAGAGQRWCEPTIEDGVCKTHASVEQFGHLYVSTVAANREGK